jgi:beta-lactamase regulating signal transducer with metallopeptidase domain
MNWLAAQTVFSFQNLAQTSQALAQGSVERILNAIPEGLLIASFAWVLLRVLRKQNSGTRFAVWFSALLTVAVLPLVGEPGLHRLGLASGISSISFLSSPAHPAISIPYGWALIFFSVWAFGALIGLTRLAIGFWNLRKLRASCLPIHLDELDPQVRNTVEEIGSELVATSNSVRVPTAVGFGKKTIILPEWSLRELSSEDLNAVLLHEFEHLRRGDDWTNLVQKIVKAVFFFHPAVWWIESRLSVEREMACDDAVLEKTSNAHGYATCLVSLLEKSLAHRLAPKPLSMAQAAIDRAREASLRLARILDANRPRATRVWKPALGMAGACSVVCLALLTAAPQFVAFDAGTDHGRMGSGPVGGGADFSMLPKANVIKASLVQPSGSARSLTTAAKPQSFQRVGVAAVPTLLRASHSSPVRENLTANSATRKLSARAVTDQVLTNQSLNQEIADERSIEQELGQFMAIHALVERQLMPQLETVVYFETRQVRMPDSSVWNVQVVRVVFVDPHAERTVKIPVVNTL